MVALRTEREKEQEQNTKQPKRTSSRAHLRIIEPEPIFSIYRLASPASPASVTGWGIPPEALPFVARKDSLPERVNYADAGCELAPSCLACPLPRCQYDEPGSVRTWLLDARDREIALLRRRHRVPIRALVRTYGLTRRHVFRILHEQEPDLRSAMKRAKASPLAHV